MSIFASIMEKIFHSAEAAVAPTAQPTAATATATSPAADTTGAAAAVSSAASPAVAAPAQTVDVGAVLGAMAANKGGGGNYQSSIVDLLKLLDLESSLSARKTLAGELGVHAGADGSAEENIALHRAVMQKLAENGGQVPASMKG